jgi:hypothetical protein
VLAGAAGWLAKVGVGKDLRSSQKTTTTDMASRWDADGIDNDGFSTDILSLWDKTECCLAGDKFGHVI